MAMRSCMRDATEKLYKKLSKIVAVANPNLGQEWLQEVELLHLLTSYIMCTNTCMIFVCILDSILSSCIDRETLDLVFSS